MNGSIEKGPLWKGSVINLIFELSLVQFSIVDKSLSFIPSLLVQKDVFVGGFFVKMQSTVFFMLSSDLIWARPFCLRSSWIPSPQNLPGEI